MFLKLMIGCATSQPFSADAVILSEFCESFKDEVIATSKDTNAKPREEIEAEIFERYRNKEANKSGTLF